MIKRLILLVILMSSYCIVNAQMKKSSIYFNGSTNFTYSSDNDQSKSITSAYLQSGYFIGDNFVLGLGYGVSYVKYKKGNNGGDPALDSFSGINDTKVRVLQLFGRYYYNNAFMGLGYESFKSTEADELNFLNIHLGYAVMLNDFIALEPRLAYNIGFSEAENNLTFQLGFGFYIFKKED